MTERVMHAAHNADPFGATLCGASDGWRTQIAADVDCDVCIAELMLPAAAETHLGMWEAETPIGPPESSPEEDALMRDLARQALALSSRATDTEQDQP